jgi:hypothetical protein
MKIALFFWTLAGVVKPSLSIGFRCQAGSRVFTTDPPAAEHLIVSVQFSCNPTKVKEFCLF